MTKQRDRGLDLLRAAAIIRVFLWHATGWSLLTWIGALPVMFFITGHLFATSAGRNGLGRTLHDRTRRLLLPYWLFGAVTLTIMLVVADGSWGMTPGDLLGWVVPIVDPVGAPWQDGWITEPLWYLRTYFWLLLLAGPLLWVLRRHPGVLLATTFLAVPLLELLFGLRYWALQDVVGYGFFFAAGIAIANGTVAPTPLLLRRVGAAALILALIWTVARPPLGGVVNNSHTLHLLVGCAWVSVSLAVLPVLRKVAERVRVRAVVDRITARSLSIYLWHAPVLGLSYVALSHTSLEGLTLTITGTALGAILTVLVTNIVGGVERRAGRATGEGQPWFPARRVLAPSLTVTLLAGALALTGPRELILPPTPSKAPEPVDLTEDEALAFLLAPEAPSGTSSVPPADESFFTSAPFPSTTVGTPGTKPGRGQDRRPVDRTPGTSNPPATTPTTITPITPTTPSVPNTPRQTRPVVDWNDLAPEIGDDLRAAIIAAAGEWVRKQKTDRQVVYETGIEIALLQPGRMRLVTTIDRDGAAAPAGESIPFASITKSFTAALLLRAVEDGRIDLDAPIGTLTVAPWFTLTRDLSLRDLLAHRSGLVTYASTRTWARDWQLIDGWEPVLRAAEEEGRSFPVGTKVEYSSTNYVVAGLLAAQLYGTPIEKLIQDHLLEPLGLRRTRVGAPIAGAPGTGTGNMSGHITDLARWGVAMWRDKTVLGGTGNALAAYTDPVQLIGYGGFSYCPCRSERGRVVVAGIGANGAEATLRYYPATDTIIAIRIPHGLTASLEDLINTLLALTR